MFNVTSLFREEDNGVFHISCSAARAIEGNVALERILTQQSSSIGVVKGSIATSRKFCLASPISVSTMFGMYPTTFVALPGVRTT